MNLIELILFLQGRNIEERAEFLKQADVAQWARSGIQNCFDDVGNLIDALGNRIEIHEVFYHGR